MNKTSLHNIYVWIFTITMLFKLKTSLLLGFFGWDVSLLVSGCLIFGITWLDWAFLNWKASNLLVLQRKITWSNIWKADFHRIRFLVQAVYDVLPSPANLHVWSKTDTPSCPQCSGRGSLEHLHSSCPKALADGRYCWRHDQVLRAVADSIATAINTIKGHHKPKTIMFHRTGEKPNIQPQAKSGLLTSATDWRLEVDLGKQLKFPARITPTRLRPDMIIVSDSTKQLIILELTVPWRAHGRGQREEACQVPGVVGWLQEARLEDALWTSGGGLPRISGAVTLQSVHTARPHRGGKEEGY